MDIVFTRNSEKLAYKIANKISFTAFPSSVKCFNNGEMSVTLRKAFREVIVIANTETNNDWIELFLLLDALKGTSKIILCISYMGYTRQDKQNPNESFAARMFSVLLETFNIFHCILVDNHSEPIIRIPTQHISAQSIFGNDILTKYNSKQIVIVSPDIGGVSRADEIAKTLGCEFVICNKERNVFGELKKITLMGNVNGKICILIDDMVDSGATLYHASESLIAAKGIEVVSYCTHGVFSGGAIELLEKSKITEIVFTDTIQKSFALSTKFRKLSIDSLIVDAIRCIL